MNSKIDKKDLLKLQSSYKTILNFNEFLNTITPEQYKNSAIKDILLICACSGWWCRILYILNKWKFISKKDINNFNLFHPIYFFNEFDNIIKHPDMEEDFEKMEEIRLNHDFDDIHVNKKWTVLNWDNELSKIGWDKDKIKWRLTQYESIWPIFREETNGYKSTYDYNNQAIEYFNKNIKPKIEPDWTNIERYNKLDLAMTNTIICSISVKQAIISNGYNYDSLLNKMIESNKINWNYDINSVQIVHPSCLYNKEFSMFIEHFLNHGNVINRDYISIDKSQIINFQNFITIEDLKKYPVILNDLKNWYIQCLKSEYGAQITYEAFLICKKLEIFKDNTQYSKNGGYIKLDALTSLGEKYLVDLK